MASQLEIAGQDGEFKGYLSVPKSGRGPGVVLLQEIFGINAYMRQMADLFAAEGFVAVVPDLFWRMEPGVDLDYSERDKAVSFMKRFDFVPAPGDIAATVKALRAHSAVSGDVGVLGYCLGGKLAVLAAAQGGVACTVSYYGVGIENILDEAKRATCPMLLHFGELDHNSPPGVIEKIAAALSDHPNVAIHVYPNADHGFNSAARAAFNQNASMQAHARTMAFFRTHLPVTPS